VTDDDVSATTFDDLGLAPKVLRALRDVGYETPSPIQASAIPPLLAGDHVVGLARQDRGIRAPDPVPDRRRREAPAGAGARAHP
jgi:ATP-dependent RNA helicase DeaD